MKILHICNGYSYSNLYKELFGKLKEKNVAQLVIAPSFEEENRLLHVAPSIDILYMQRKSSYFHRLFFQAKVLKIFKYIVENVCFEEYRVVHAHSLFSDGAVALHIFHQYKCPYIVAVRNTDLNFFFKYLIWNRALGFEILKNASKVICISPSYKKRLLDLLPFHLRKSVEAKCLVIPNGINEGWLNNRHYKSICLEKPINLIYIGEISRNKNIHSTLKSVELIRNKGIDVNFFVVGKGLNDQVRYLKKLIEKERECRFFHIYKSMSPEELRNFMDGMDLFIMPSYTETFGLVYVEALSQGLPIIYSANEGFDNFYSNGSVGFSVDPYQISSICRAIKDVLENYSRITEFIKQENLEKFDWNNIADIYKSIYLKIDENNSFT